ncbi:cytochrome c oxidase subunit II [Nitrosococcus oceani]|nr:cytochrome c oxidase subunit II [Nitrosococcus oceani]EDZ67570.1 cytochrome c oxidase, subunit II, putative [Nitrosococcus oceani AFC27]KFI19353.1 cytochrome B561 [Nitrosococcus oceani C-27]KFI22600.1 cytochrome B561 [Nitrosococcus oceani]GEM20459.1 cytochrome c oxidase subunit II [Nitrosococcus oceani]
MGCEGPQSALNPAGRGAEQIAQLFWWLVAVNTLIWILVVGLAVYAAQLRPGAHPHRRAKLLIIGGGVIFPILVLTIYLTYGLSLMPALLKPADSDDLQIAVSGEQWWWRVRYLSSSGGEVIELANEIRLPLGESVNLLLDSPDVIHSFWVPSLTGKMDMIPGRISRLTLKATKVGVYHGVCAEYCGSAHALMKLDVVVMTPDAFAAWLAAQGQPAAVPQQALAARGQELFQFEGCSACHTIRGTAADGQVGPDLTHVGSRLSLGAGTLPNKPAAFLRWIAHTEKVKPGVHMPAFGMLPEKDLRALAMFLEGLQ